MIVSTIVIPCDFSGFTGEQRLAMCRKLAREAALRAYRSADPDTERAYLDVKRQWEALAAELEENALEAPSRLIRHLDSDSQARGTCLAIHSVVGAHEVGNRE
jgi:hypothetical protein